MTIFVIFRLSWSTLTYSEAGCSPRSPDLKWMWVVLIFSCIYHHNSPGVVRYSNIGPGASKLEWPPQTPNAIVPRHCWCSLCIMRSKPILLVSRIDSAVTYSLTLQSILSPTDSKHQASYIMTDSTHHPMHSAYNYLSLLNHSLLVAAWCAQEALLQCCNQFP